MAMVHTVHGDVCVYLVAMQVFVQLYIFFAGGWERYYM